VLKDPWPKQMTFLFPPLSLTGACITKACHEHLLGKDIIVLAAECQVRRTFDTNVTRKLSILKMAGQLIFQPFREPSKQDYNIYFFLTPNTYKRIMRLKAIRTGRHGKHLAQTTAQEEADEIYMNKVYDQAVNMMWTNVPKMAAERLLGHKLPDSAKLRRIIARKEKERKEKYTGTRFQ